MRTKAAIYFMLFCFLNVISGASCSTEATNVQDKIGIKSEVGYDAVVKKHFIKFTLMNGSADVVKIDKSIFHRSFMTIVLAYANGKRVLQESNPLIGVSLGEWVLEPKGSASDVLYLTDYFLDLNSYLERTDITVFWRVNSLPIQVSEDSQIGGAAVIKKTANQD